MGPGGKAGQLTEHRPRWTGTHDPVQSLPDTKLKAQTDTDTREESGSEPTGIEPTSSPQNKTKGAKKGSVSWAPDLERDLVSESSSDTVSNSHTDTETAAHLEPDPAPGQDVDLGSATVTDAGQERKFSLDSNVSKQETEKPRRDSSGEHWSRNLFFLIQSKSNHPPSHSFMT